MIASIFTDVVVNCSFPKIFTDTPFFNSIKEISSNVVSCSIVRTYSGYTNSVFEIRYRNDSCRENNYRCNLLISHLAKLTHVFFFISCIERAYIHLLIVKHFRARLYERGKSFYPRDLLSPSPFVPSLQSGGVQFSVR